MAVSLQGRARCGSTMAKHLPRRMTSSSSPSTTGSDHLVSFQPGMAESKVMPCIYKSLMVYAYIHIGPWLNTT